MSRWPPLLLGLCLACGARPTSVGGGPQDESGSEASGVDTDSGEATESDASGSTEDTGATSEDDGGDEGQGEGGTSDNNGPCGLEGLVNPGLVPVAEGEPVYFFTEVAHTGELINICRFAGKPMMLNLCAAWCGPCHNTAACIAGDDAQCGNLFPGGLTPGVQAMIDAIRANLTSGKINWVEIMYQSQSGGIPDQAYIEEWHEQYPQENVWVFSDPDQISTTWLPAPGIPFFVSVDETFHYEHVNSGYEWPDMAEP